MKAYEPLTEKNPTSGLFYNEWDVPEGFPINYSWTLVKPSEELLFPVYDQSSNTWNESKDLLVNYLRTENTDLKAHLATTEGALLDLADTILGGQE